MTVDITSTLDTRIHSSKGAMIHCRCKPAHVKASLQSIVVQSSPRYGVLSTYIPTTDSTLQRQASSGTPTPSRIHLQIRICSYIWDRQIPISPGRQNSQRLSYFPAGIAPLCLSFVSPLLFWILFATLPPFSLSGLQKSSTRSSRQCSVSRSSALTVHRHNPVHRGTPRLPLLGL